MLEVCILARTGYCATSSVPFDQSRQCTPPDDVPESRLDEILRARTSFALELEILRLVGSSRSEIGSSKVRPCWRLLDRYGRHLLHGQLMSMVKEPKRQPVVSICP